MNARRGFTLIEMLIVIIIIVILAGAAVGMMNLFSRGQGVRQGAMIISQAVAQAKQRASEKHRVFFLVFPKVKTGADDSVLEIHEDTNLNGVYDGDQDPKTTTDADKPIDGKPIDLPKYVVFDNAPLWIGFAPSGYMSFDAAFSQQEMSASEFDGIMNGPSPTPNGDIIIRIKNQPFIMCMDLDRASGKVRRFQFLNEGGGQ